MSQLSRNYRKKLGHLLVKLSKSEYSLTQEETNLAKVLESRALVKFIGPDRIIKPMSLADSVSNIWAAGLAHFEITGAGTELIAQYGEQALVSGRYLFPGETVWYDRWPWKLLWPAIVSIITTLIVTWIKK
jgi:hypothetical protein